MIATEKKKKKKKKPKAEENNETVVEAIDEQEGESITEEPKEKLPELPTTGKTLFLFI